MDMHHLNVRRVPGVAGGRNVKERGILINALSLASLVSFKPTHAWLWQHKIVGCQAKKLFA